MGAAYSSNTLNNVLDEILQIINTNSQSCRVAGEQLQELNFTNITTLDGKGIVISGLNWDQMAQINASCYQSSNFTASLTSAITQAFNQAATSTVSNYGIGFSDAQNIVNNYTSLTEQIVNTVQQTVQTTMSQNQSINFSGVTASGITVNFLNWSQTMGIVSSAVQNVVNNSNLVSTVQQAVSQTATATVSGINWTLIIVVIVVCLCVFFTGGTAVVGTKVFNWKFLAGASGVVILVLLIIYFVNKSKQDNANNQAQQYQQQQNQFNQQNHIKVCTSGTPVNCPNNGESASNYECYLGKWCMNRTPCINDEYIDPTHTRNSYLSMCVDYSAPSPSNCIRVPGNYICSNESSGLTNLDRFVTPGHCATSNDCSSEPVGHDCQNGVCTSIVSCSIDGDCGNANYICNNKACRPNNNCTSDSQCGTTATKCQLDTTLPYYGSCINPTCGSKMACCNSNSDCKLPTTCDLTIHQCISPPCYSNADCSPPLTCDTTTHNCISP